MSRLTLAEQLALVDRCLELQRELLHPEQSEGVGRRIVQYGDYVVLTHDEAARWLVQHLAH